MAQRKVQLTIPLDSLMESVKGLTLAEQPKLYDLLAEQLFADEPVDVVETADIQAARDAFAAGEFVSIDEYIEKKRS